MTTLPTTKTAPKVGAAAPSAFSTLTRPLAPMRRRPAKAADQLIQHSGITGIRVNVLRAGLRHRTTGAVKKDWTSVSVTWRDLPDLLKLADQDVRTVSDAIRFAALAVPARHGSTFSSACIAGARRLLTQARADADAELARQAAENNAHWEHVS